MGITLSSRNCIALACICMALLAQGCRKDKTPQATASHSRISLMESAVDIPALGRFEAQTWDDEIYCYAKSIRFKGNICELILYPNEDGTPLTADQRKNLRQRFLDFETSVDAALAKDLSRQLRDVCRQYRIDISALSDDDLRRDLNWHNVKLEPEGTIECYTDNQRVSKSLDIVLRFSPDMCLSEVYFDG